MICVARPIPMFLNNSLSLLHLQQPQPHHNSSNPKKQKRNGLLPLSNITHFLRPFLNRNKKPTPNLLTPTITNSCSTRWRKTKISSSGNAHVAHVAEGHSEGRMWALCGLGFWVQGFRCFPWLALNFHMAHGLGLGPAAVQLVQHAGSLPLVAKPVFGLLSDAVYIGGAHRVPYISIGVFVQALSWGILALVPTTGGTFPARMACILLSNLGASITEVVSDALVAEFSKNQKVGELQSYAFIALAAGALLGNLSGGFFLLKTQEPKTMFLTFSLLPRQILFGGRYRRILANSCLNWLRLSMRRGFFTRFYGL